MVKIVQEEKEKEEIGRELGKGGDRPTKVKKKKATSIEKVVRAFDEENRDRIRFTRVSRGLKRIFNKSLKVRPGFSSSWVFPSTPPDARMIRKYKVNGSEIGLLSLKDKPHSLYQLNPIEYQLDVEYMELLEKAKKELLEYKPAQMEIETSEQTREFIKKVGKRLINQLARKHDIPLGESREEKSRNLKQLTNILARYTVGLGVFEYFLEDRFLQDAYIDSPPSENEVYLSLGGINEPDLYDEFRTNVIVGKKNVKNMLSRFRYESGRAFSEANPVLEMDLDSYETRVTVTGQPLSPSGVAMAFRKRASNPWTLLKFIENGTITPTAAGLISFLLEGRSTMMIAGSRGAGKTSMLSAILLEFPISQRIITIEDTLELPVNQMQELDFNVQSLAVESSLGTEGEMTAEEALRVSLRLGESALVLGEVRGDEARTLYEAMRTGTAGSSVLGTFHGNSAEAVYERATGDMNIPPESFMATDIIIVCGLTKPKGSQKYKREVVQVAELKKDAPKPGEMENLMEYNEDKRRLEKTETFSYRSEKIGSIAGFQGLELEEALKNIELRARYRKYIVDKARETGNRDLLSPEWVLKSNNKFWSLTEKYSGMDKLDHDKIYQEWKEWFDRRV